MNANLVALAKELTQSKPHELPEKLLQLEQLLQRTTSVITKYEIIALNILPMLLLTLRQDFNNIADGWNLASMHLSPLASSCLIVQVDRNNTKIKEWSGLFFDKYLPQGVDSFIILTRRLQDRYNQEKKAHLRQTFITYISNVLDNLLAVLNFHSTQYGLFKQVLNSNKFMELFLADDLYICPLMTNAFTEIVKKSGRSRGSSVFADLPSKLKHDYVNELAYKLTVFDSNEVGRAAVRGLIAVCEMDSSMITLLVDKLKGLPTILQRWQGRGFGVDLQNLLAITRRGTKGIPYSRETRGEHYAASRIQALWRGYLTRKRLMKANEAMRRFQNIYRQRKRREADEKERARLQAEVQYQAVREHLRRLRLHHLQRIQTISVLPASEVEKYLEVERLQSAMKIQAWFRGYLQRRRMNTGERQRLIVEKAARRIQRAFRDYRQKKQAELERRQQRLEYIKPSILTEAKREEIIEQIERWKSERAPRPMSDDEFLALHNRTQENLRQYVTTNRAWRRIEQRQRVLLNMMNNDAELLFSNYPKLKSAMEPGSQLTSSTSGADEAAPFLTHPSAPVRYRARQAHVEALKFARAPWYKSLQLANMDEDDDDDDGDRLLNQADLDDLGRSDILNNPNRYEYEKRKFYLFESKLSTTSIGPT